MAEVLLHKRVETALNSLGPEEQHLVMRAMASLADGVPDDAVKLAIQSAPVYSLVVTREVRIEFLVDKAKDEIVVLDIRVRRRL